eukprot:TRINITY_DN24241_c0_g1_i1.p1 TRINITY_DN24241_c0_g1~~TRINITY_DN24241_c0_g1_i1.p1  ORF type:complete len:588 (-),score=104.62 TRINITY_DN24241_c0_g1_i1:57-1820(-)
MDFSLKPSCFTYDLRSKTAENSNRAKTQGHQDALLALVDRQLDVAAAKMRAHQHKHAVDLLHRIYSIVLDYQSRQNQSLPAQSPRRPHTSPVQTEEHGSPSHCDERPRTSPVKMDIKSMSAEDGEAQTEQVSKVAKLGIAAIRIQLCNALSQLGRHTQALDEAFGAKKELDELWADTTASIEMTRDQPDQILQPCMGKPRWLERAIVCSIQARLQMAAEMEFLLPHDEVQIALKDDMPTESKEIDKLAILTGSPTVQSRKKKLLGSPAPPPSNGQVMRRLYREAVTLAARLLPEGHRSSKEALRTETEALSRWKQAVDRWQQGMADIGRLKVQAHDPQLTAATLQDPLQSQLGAEEQEYLAEDDMISYVSAKWLETCSLNSYRSTQSGTTESFSYISSAASSAGPLMTPLHRSSSAPSGKKRDKKKAPDSTNLQKIDRKLDPFTDWQKNCVSKEDMTVFQSELLTYEGIDRLHTKLKSDKVRFKQFMQELAQTHDADERLHDMRTFYTKSGIITTKKGQAKMDAVREAAMRPSEHAIKAAKREESLFAYYGMSKLLQTSLDAKALRKLMEASMKAEEEKQPRRRKKR